MLTLTPFQLVIKLGVAEDHIFSSRDLTFVKGIMRVTKGKGVDLVLNSLSGEVPTTSKMLLCTSNVSTGSSQIVGFACSVWSFHRNW